MKRQIKFRGIAVGFNKWAYGYYVNKNPEKHQIIAFDTILPVLVEPNTVGEFTGEISKEIEVFEGDIIEIDGSGKRLVVVFKNGCFYSINSKIGSKYRLGGWEKDSYTVIGNIHYNPELLNQ